MNWFERHLHWTVVIVMLVAGFAWGILRPLLLPGILDEAFSGVTFLLGWIVQFPVFGWLLEKKNRNFLNLFWLIIPVGWIVLFCLENRSEPKAMQVKAVEPGIGTQKEEQEIQAGETDKSPSYTSQSWIFKVSSAVLAVTLIAVIVYSVVVTRDRDALNTELESVETVLTSTQAELVSTQTELSSTTQKLSSVQSELEATKTELDAIDAKLKLYEDTMGIKIFSGIQQPPLQGASPIRLVNNSAATNPSWQQLISFLRADPTDDRTYTKGIFVSGDFANMLHNNAEAAGTRAAWVGVFFEGETIGHGLNAFKTTDRGLVYVETQSDYIAYVTKGKEYGTISLGQNTPLDYASYEKMKADWNYYDQKLEAYNREVKAYNNELFGKVYYIGTVEWFRIKAWERTLEDQKRVLDSLRAQLEYLVGKPMGIVERIVIYW